MNYQAILDAFHWHRESIVEALAYAGDTHAPDDVLRMLMQDDAHIWSNEDAFIITEMRTFPKQRHVHIWLCGGELRACKALELQVQDAAQTVGATHMTGTGRRGWERTMAGTGWEPLGTLMIKELEQPHVH